MIDRHWGGIAAYCKPENKVSLGFVEGLKNKIRVIRARPLTCPSNHPLDFPKSLNKGVPVGTSAACAA